VLLPRARVGANHWKEDVFVPRRNAAVKAEHTRLVRQFTQRSRVDASVGIDDNRISRAQRLGVDVCDRQRAREPVAIESLRGARVDDEQTGPPVPDPLREIHGGDFIGNRWRGHVAGECRERSHAEREQRQHDASMALHRTRRSIHSAPANAASARRTTAATTAP